MIKFLLFQLGCLACASPDFVMFVLLLVGLDAFTAEYEMPESSLERPQWTWWMLFAARVKSRQFNDVRVIKFFLHLRPLLGARHIRIAMMKESRVHFFHYCVELLGHCITVWQFCLFIWSVTSIAEKVGRAVEMIWGAGASRTQITVVVLVIRWFLLIVVFSIRRHIPETVLWVILLAWWLINYRRG